MTDRMPVQVRPADEATIEALIKGTLRAEEDADGGGDIPVNVVYFIVVVMVGEDGKNEAGVTLIPDCDNGLSDRLSACVTEEWVRSAPVGVYSYKYDYDAMVEVAGPDNKGEHFLLCSGPGDHDQMHALERQIANDLVMAGIQLYDAFASLPSDEELIERFDTSVNETIAHAAQYNITRYQPGCVCYMVAGSREKKLRVQELTEQGALCIIPIGIPEGGFPFSNHLKKGVKVHVERVIKGREEIVVRARVRQLWRERNKVATGRKMRERIDAQIDHLCLVFGIDEETATQHTHWNLGLDISDLEDPPENIFGLAKPIKAK
jgi:hypothetical protein